VRAPPPRHPRANGLAKIDRVLRHARLNKPRCDKRKAPNGNLEFRWIWVTLIHGLSSASTHSHTKRERERERERARARVCVLVCVCALVCTCDKMRQNPTDMTSKTNTRTGLHAYSAGRTLEQPHLSPEFQQVLGKQSIGIKRKGTSAERERERECV
jgi:hypothetical protein